MNDSVWAFASKLIDYAGLFPPARQPMAEALANYAQYATGPHRWILNRFLCPADRLAELEAHLPQNEVLNPLPLAIVGQGGATENEYLKDLKADLVTVDEFKQAHGDRFTIEVFESRLPSLSDPGNQLAQAGKLLMRAKLTPFFEASLEHGWPAVVEALSQIGGMGFKLRCGGEHAGAFPSASQVAMVLIACRKANVPLKFTAGLHQPYPHFDKQLNATHHGFVNLYAAGIFTQLFFLEEDRLVEILEHAEAADLPLDSLGLHYKEMIGDPYQINDIRHNNLLSFGSCAFDEPVAAMQVNGWF